LITSLYSFRVVFIVFFGEPATGIDYAPGWRISIVLVVLALLSLAGGFIELPYITEASVETQYVFEAIAGVTSVTGIILAYLLFAGQRRFVGLLLNSKFCAALRDLWFADCGFDWLYRTFLVRPYQWFACINSDDFLDRIYDGVAVFCSACNQVLSGSVTGNVRWYVAGLVIGSVIIIGFVILV
jgi:NADH-quinone oxidoreductase subunit L